MSVQCPFQLLFDVDRIQPKITIDDASIENVPDFQAGPPGKNFGYLMFDNRGRSRINATFMIPSLIQRIIPSVIFKLSLTHRKIDSCLIDIIVNGRMFLQSVTPPDQFQLQSFVISDSFANILRRTQPNTITIQLSSLTQGNYNLSDLQFQFESTPQLDSQLILAEFGTKVAAYEDVTGVLAENVTWTDLAIESNPLSIVLEKDESLFSGTFRVPSKYRGTTGKWSIEIDRVCLVSASSTVSHLELKINGKSITSWDVSPEQTAVLRYEQQNLDSLLTDGSLNVFSLSRRPGDSASIVIGETKLNLGIDVPVFGWNTLTTAVKQTILMNRRNIDTLTPIPRDDMSMYAFLKEAPGWFLLMYAKFHPWELYLLWAHFYPNLVQMGKAALQVYELVKAAWDFRSDLNSIDWPRKNSYRHAYWMATTTQALGARFANDLGNMHEDCHRDLTIEGPFDHVTDRINNTIGIKLAQLEPTGDMKAAVDSAWNFRHLAVARNFRTQNGIQKADVQWQEPLNYLSQAFHVIPTFSVTELQTLKRCNVTVPLERTINEELQPALAKTYAELDDDSLDIL